MARDFWTAIELKLESAEIQLRQASRDINPELPAHYAAIQSTGADVSDPPLAGQAFFSSICIPCRMS